jgi:hypothetical protein
MPSFLVETFLPRASAIDRVSWERRARSAAESLTQSGTRVRFTGLIHVPADEICFYAFEAPNAGNVALVADRAGLRALRIVEAVSSMEGGA